MEKNWDEPQIKVHKYYFKGMQKPIRMVASSKDEADEMLRLLPEKSGVGIDMSLLEDYRVESLVTGISKLSRFGKTYIWVGLNKSQDGWMLEEEFNKVTGNE